MGRALSLYLAFAWLLVIRHLHREWTYNPHYHYGWLVPFLACYLAVQRRGPATPGLAGWGRNVVQAGLVATALMEAILVWIAEANPDWRLLGWVLAAMAALATALALLLVSGWAGLRAQLLPLFFVFTAVPWPRPVELAMMQSLQMHNASWVASVLRAFGVPTAVEGSVIVLRGMALDVDAACSGIRSLQAALMASLFAGEMFELAWRRRIFLVLTGLGAALLFNFGRLVVLGCVVAREGAGALPDWHDPAGRWSQIFCVAVIGIAGWLLKGRLRTGGLRAGLETESSLGDVPALRASAAVGLLCVAVLGGGWAASSAWYRAHEERQGDPVPWRFDPPTGRSGSQRLEPKPYWRGELRYDSYAGGIWRDPNGWQWVGHYFRWEPGSNAVGTVLVHDPRVCLGATGKHLEAQLPAVRYPFGGITLLFDAYRFRDERGALFVFNGVADDVEPVASDPSRVSGEVTMASRLRAVAEGRRHRGQRRLEIAVRGPSNGEAASRGLLEVLAGSIRWDRRTAPSGNTSVISSSTNP